MTNKINGIDVSEYFTNHYDNSGKLYAVEYKGNPLELQNAIKRLQEENKDLEGKKDEYYLRTLDYETKISYLIQALEEIRKYCEEQNLKADYTACYITNRIDEVLNEQK